MAININDVLSSPSIGYQRFNIDHAAITYQGASWSISDWGSSYNTYNNITMTTTTVEEKMFFNFTGSKLVLRMYSNHDTSGFNIKVDGIDLGDFKTNYGIVSNTVVFVKENFEDKEHFVEITCLDNSVIGGSKTRISVDSIDIDSTGQLLSYIPIMLEENVYFLITTIMDKICYYDEINNSVVETDTKISSVVTDQQSIIDNSFKSIEDLNLKIDDLNILKGYKIKVLNKTSMNKVSLSFSNDSVIATIVPKEFINTTHVNSFESLEIINRGTFNVVFSNKSGEWCYFDEMKTKVIIDSLNGEVDLLNIEPNPLNFILNNQSNNYIELENLLEEIYLYAKETEQIKLGILLPPDNEIQQIRINSIIEGSYQPLILGQDYTYNIKQNEIDVVLSDTYDSNNNKIRINLMK